MSLLVIGRQRCSQKRVIVFMQRCCHSAERKLDLWFVPRWAGRRVQSRWWVKPLCENLWQFEKSIHWQFLRTWFVSMSFIPSAKHMRNIFFIHHFCFLIKINSQKVLRYRLGGHNNWQSDPWERIRRLELKKINTCININSEARNQNVPRAQASQNPLGRRRRERIRTW